MNIKEKLTADLKDAMRSKDAVKREAIRGITLAITNFEKANPGIELNLSKILRQLEGQSLQTFASVQSMKQEDSEQDKSELIAKAMLELAIIKGYIADFLPEQLTEEDIKEAAQEIIEALGASKNDIGKVMGEFKKKFGAAVDMKKANEAVRLILQ